MFDINLLINNFVYKNEEVNIDTYRRVLILFFYLVSISLFFIFAIIFFIEGHKDFAFIKGFLAILSFIMLMAFKNKNKHTLNASLLSIMLVSYSIISFLDPTETRYGFIWTFFIPACFIFLLGYKKGLVPSMFYCMLILFVGSYDVLAMKNQFLDMVSFSLYYCSLLAFLFICIIVDYFFVLFHNKIVNISVTDPLTKLFNRRKIDEVLKDEIVNKNILSLAILDIDNFKLINDEKGHQVGDEVLKLFADNLKKNIRSTDIVGRWGGEEFIIVLPNTSVTEAYKCMEKIQNCNKQLKYENLENLTCSFGIAYSENNDLTLDELITQADKALYQAKKDGKDRIEIFDNLSKKI